MTLPRGTRTQVIGRPKNTPKPPIPLITQVSSGVSNTTIVNATGTVRIEGTYVLTDGSGNATLTFSPAYTNPPVCVITPLNGLTLPLIANMTLLSPTSVTINVKDTTNTAAGGVIVHVITMGT